ncbi:baculoviral IAP repeat-containing protein 2-like [Perca flavescens]|uniref:baculoviral IAP repeat-containing protein 2-like n=1 Tax=Perca flavescens TaxID=8167 RepID=UPI00106DE25D|nr:baculoviral IAP repeat-containing protein 2-like [Perca flavescens]
MASNVTMKSGGLINTPLGSHQQSSTQQPSGTTQGENQEVPMETDQLEEALMMKSPVVKEALQMGVPPHLIKPKLHAKILSDKDGYADVNELLKDLNM